MLQGTGESAPVTDRTNAHEWWQVYSRATCSLAACLRPLENGQCLLPVKLVLVYASYKASTTGVPEISSTTTAGQTLPWQRGL